MAYTIEFRAIAGETNVETLYQDWDSFGFVWENNNKKCDTMFNDFFVQKNAPRAKG